MHKTKAAVSFMYGYFSEATCGKKVMHVHAIFHFHKEISVQQRTHSELYIRAPISIILWRLITKIIAMIMQLFSTIYHVTIIMTYRIYYRIYCTSYMDYGYNEWFILVWVNGMIFICGWIVSLIKGYCVQKRKENYDDWTVL